jgi:CheY-like chemotaxis protein
LLVDDDAQLRDVISQFLTAADIPHECAGNAEEAWAKMSETLPVAVVSDIEMPGMSGLELCRRIKADAQTRYIPVLLMSGNLDYESRCRAAGAAEFFAKPLDFSQFTNQLKKFLA